MGVGVGDKAAPSNGLSSPCSLRALKRLKSCSQMYTLKRAVWFTVPSTHRPPTSWGVGGGGFGTGALHS